MMRDFDGRIIPTRVGTRHRALLKLISSRDHPHACGDKVSFSGYKHGRLGSSPRVWGQEERQYIANDVLGIIPTRVGTRKDTKFVAGKT